MPELYWRRSLCKLRTMKGACETYNLSNSSEELKIGRTAILMPLRVLSVAVVISVGTPGLTLSSAIMQLFGRVLCLTKGRGFSCWVPAMRMTALFRLRDYDEKPGTEIRLLRCAGLDFDNLLWRFAAQ